MRRNGWHILREDGAVTLARRLPVRFDLRVEADLPEAANPARIAHQVRQDIWRSLRHLRGFAPVVRAARTATGLHLTAGGQIMAPCDRAAAQACIAEVLADHRNRARWLRWAA